MPVPVIRGLNDDANDIILVRRQGSENHLWIIRQFPLEYPLASFIDDPKKLLLESRSIPKYNLIKHLLGWDWRLFPRAYQNRLGSDMLGGALYMIIMILTQRNL